MSETTQDEQGAVWSLSPRCPKPNSCTRKQDCAYGSMRDGEWMPACETAPTSTTPAAPALGDAERAEIAARWFGVGPWEHSGSLVGIADAGVPWLHVASCQQDDDAPRIAAAPADVARLLAAHDALAARVAALEGLLRHASQHLDARSNAKLLDRIDAALDAARGAQ